MSVLTDLRNRGVRDVFFLVCDGLKGLPEVVANVWPYAVKIRLVALLATSIAQALVVVVLTGRWRCWRTRSTTSPTR